MPVGCEPAADEAGGQARVDDKVYPRISPLGLAGFLVTFGDGVTDAVNRDALAFGAALRAAGMPGVEEVATSLASVFVRCDVAVAGAMGERLAQMVAARDWAGQAPGGRLWRIPVAFGGRAGPQLAEAAALAGMTEAEAVRDLAAARPRVLAIGFAPGQPYLGQLGAQWNLPRQQDLTRQVPVGALVVAIRQLVLFATSAPTGWRHVGQTAFRAFRPGRDDAFAFRPGDRVVFAPVPEAQIRAALAADDPDGGAVLEEFAC